MSGTDRCDCCTPKPPVRSALVQMQKSAEPNSGDFGGEWLSIAGGTAIIGSNRQQIRRDGEGPARRLQLSPFEMLATTVTNRMFAVFADATGYATEAERFGWSFVFWLHLEDALSTTQGVQDAPWWRRVDGANWRYPYGPGMPTAANTADYPAVHISWNDANAFAAWAGGRLPTEVEWEHAARGGLGDVAFPWGRREPNEVDFFPCNIWQGEFPNHYTGADGYYGLAPARSYKANGHGLFNMVGNVWEWTADPFSIAAPVRGKKQRLAETAGYRVSKGGSYLCHKSYCYRYRIPARSGNSPDSSSCHQGFRIVRAVSSD